jgi:hypothetical protein
MDRVWNTRKGFLGKEVVRAREMATVEGIMTGTPPNIAEKHASPVRISQIVAVWVLDQFVKAL